MSCLTCLPTDIKAGDRLLVMGSYLLSGLLVTSFFLMMTCLVFFGLNSWHSACTVERLNLTWDEQHTTIQKSPHPIFCLVFTLLSSSMVHLLDQGKNQWSWNKTFVVTQWSDRALLEMSTLHLKNVHIHSLRRLFFILRALTMTYLFSPRVTQSEDCEMNEFLANVFSLYVLLTFSPTISR